MEETEASELRFIGNKVRQIGASLRPQFGPSDEPGISPRKRAMMILTGSLLGLTAGVALIIAGLIRSEQALINWGVGLLMLIIGYWLG